MVYLQQVSNASVNTNRPVVLEEAPEEVSDIGQFNPFVDKLSFDELVAMAEEYVEIDKQIKRAKEHKLRIWGQDKYFSKPLGINILERENLSSETTKLIDTLQDRKDHVERIIYLNRDNILSNISPELLRNKINKSNPHDRFVRYTPYKPALPNQNGVDVVYGDSIALPEFVARKFQAVCRMASNQILNILASKEAIVDEFKRHFIKGNVSRESRLLVQIIIEHKKGYLNITNSAA